MKGNVDSSGVSQGLLAPDETARDHSGVNGRGQSQKVLFATCVYKPTKSRRAPTPGEALAPSGSTFIAAREP